MTDSIRRLEDRGDRLAVITKDWMDIADYRSANVLTNEYEDLYTDVEGKDAVRVGTAAHPDGRDTFHIHGVNGLYFEAPIIERELTDSEIEWCEETFMHAGDRRPETVIEFEIPHPEDLRTAIFDENIAAFDQLTTRNPNHEVRNEILTTIQKHLEEERFRQTQLSWMKGYPVKMDAEWDPESDHNDDRDADHLNDMAGMRSDAHMVDFSTVVGIDYYTFFYARARHLGIHEPHLEHWDLIALEVIGKSDWSYCRECGGVLPEEQFLHVQRRGYDEGRTLRVCDDCADSDYAKRFTEESVNEAKDNRAQRLGGQRRLVGEYSPSNNEDSDTE